MGDSSSVFYRILHGVHDNRVRATWRILSALLLTFVGGFGGLFLIQQVGIEVPDWAVLPTVQLFAVIGVLLALVVLARYLDRREPSDYGFDLSLHWGIDAFAGVLCGIGLVGLGFAFAYQQGTVRIVDVVSAGTADSLGLAIGVVVVGWILLGFWEETLFRGMFLKNAAEGLAARRLSPKAAIFGAWLSSSLIFGLLHGPSGSNPGPHSVAYTLLMTGVLGGLFGWAYLLTEELAFPIGLHMGINLADANFFFGTPDTAVPTLLQVEHSVSGGPVQLQSLDPYLSIPIFICGYLLITGYFYLRHGSIRIRFSMASYEFTSTSTSTT